MTADFVGMSQSRSTIKAPGEEQLTTLLNDAVFYCQASLIGTLQSVLQREVVKEADGRAAIKAAGWLDNPDLPLPSATPVDTVESTNINSHETMYLSSNFQLRKITRAGISFTHRALWKINEKIRRNKRLRIAVHLFNCR